jgi:hypothetical protein
MIKLLSARYLGDFQIELTFSDGKEGTFSGLALLKKQGPLLDALREESVFGRFFIDAGALCWPNGLELSPSRLYEACQSSVIA